MSSHVAHDLSATTSAPIPAPAPEKPATKPTAEGQPQPTAKTSATKTHGSANKTQARAPSQPWADPVKPSEPAAKGAVPTSKPVNPTATAAPATASPASTATKAPAAKSATSAAPAAKNQTAVPTAAKPTTSTAAVAAAPATATAQPMRGVPVAGIQVAGVPLQPLPGAREAAPLVEETTAEPVPFLQEWTTGRSGRMLQCACVSTVLHMFAVLLLALIHITVTQTGGGLELFSSIDDVGTGLQESLDEASMKFDALDAVSNEMPAIAMAANVTGELTASPKVSDDVSAVSLSSGIVTVDMLGGAGRQEDLGKTGKAAFFGTVSSGKRFIFVVDNSNSMKNGKFTKACAEMLESVSNLSPKQKFLVILFSDKAHMMFEPDPPPDLVPIDSATWAQLEKWIKEMPLYRGTNAKDSMRRALAYKPDAIYLLTDGMFTDDTEKYLLGLKDTSIPIHTIGFTSRKGEETLKRIADKFGGTYTFVPK